MEEKHSRSRRINISVGDMNMEKQAYCRKCMKIKRKDEFYPCVDKSLDSNGFLSICKTCISDMFMESYEKTNSIELAVLRCCQKLQIKFDQTAIDAAKKNLEGRESIEFKNFFGLYKASLTRVNRVSRTDNATDLNFIYTDNPIVNLPNREELSNDSFEDAKNLKLFWGTNYSVEEYEYLEKEIADWKRSYSCQNKGEEFILKELSYKGLELKQARERGQDTDSILKSIQTIMKTGALTPAQSNAASGNKGNETWGMIVKLVEETHPAEYYKDKNLFKDFDGIEKNYIIPYIVRSIGNFIQGKRDFDIQTEDSFEDSEYDVQEGDGENGEHTKLSG